MSLPQNVPTAVVELDQQRTIAFTLGGLRRLKEQTKRELDEALSDEHLLDNLGACVWALLVKEDRAGLRVEDVEDMIAPGMVGQIVEAIGSLASVSTPEGKAEAATAAP